MQVHMRNCKMSCLKVINSQPLDYKSLLYMLQTIALCVTNEWFTSSKDMVWGLSPALPQGKGALSDCERLIVNCELLIVNCLITNSRFFILHSTFFILPVRPPVLPTWFSVDSLPARSFQVYQSIALSTIFCELTQAPTGGLTGGLWEVLGEVLREVLKKLTRW